MSNMKERKLPTATTTHFGTVTGTKHIASMVSISCWSVVPDLIVTPCEVLASLTCHLPMELPHTALRRVHHSGVRISSTLAFVHTVCNCSVGIIVLNVDAQRVSCLVITVQDIRIVPNFTLR